LHAKRLGEHDRAAGVADADLLSDSSPMAMQKPDPPCDD